MSLKKALHDAGMCDDKIKRGQRDTNTSKKGTCLWCNYVQNTKQVFWKLLLPTCSEKGKNGRDYVCKEARNNNMMKKYMHLLPRAVKLQNIMRFEGR